MDLSDVDETTFVSSDERRDVEGIEGSIVRRSLDAEEEIAFEDPDKANADVATPLARAIRQRWQQVQGAVDPDDVEEDDDEDEDEVDE